MADYIGIRCEASYIVVRTRQNEFPEILSTGRYLDVVACTRPLLTCAAASLCAFQRRSPSGPTPWSWRREKPTSWWMHEAA